MILQRLAEHYDRIAASGDEDAQLAPPGFSRQKISFRVVLELDGRLVAVQSMQQQKGRALIATTMLLPGQGKPSGQGINPCFLWDNAAYMLGLVSAPDPDLEKKEKQTARALLAFEAFRDKHLEIEAQVAHPAYTAVCSFLRNWDPGKAMEVDAELAKKATNFGVFRIAGEMRYVHELIHLPGNPEDSEKVSESTETDGLCLVTGMRTQIARLHEPKIKGVVGAQSSGALLVSFNAPSFESYGKSQSYNGPVSEDAAFRYANALNHLLDRRDRRVSLGDSTVIFWADHASVLEDCFSGLFADPMPKEDAVVEEDQERIKQAKILLTQLRDGTAETKIDLDDSLPTRFFLARTVAECFTYFGAFLGRGGCGGVTATAGTAFARYRAG